MTAVTYVELRDWADAFSELMDTAGLEGRDRDTALVILTALLVGPDEERVAEVSGIDPAWVASRALALRQNSIWREEGVMAYDWLTALLDGDTAEAIVGLVLDTLVADREVVRLKGGYRIAEPSYEKLVWDSIYGQDSATILVTKKGHGGLRNAVTKVGRQIGRDLGTATVSDDGTRVLIEVSDRRAA